MTRQEANRKILEILAKKIEDWPDTRFGQLMRNIEVVQETTVCKSPDIFSLMGEIFSDTEEIFWRNEFNLESEALLNRIQNSFVLKEI